MPFFLISLTILLILNLFLSYPSIKAFKSLGNTSLSSNLTHLANELEFPLIKANSNFFKSFSFDNVKLLNKNIKITNITTLIILNSNFLSLNKLLNPFP